MAAENRVESLMRNGCRDRRDRRRNDGERNSDTTGHARGCHGPVRCRARLEVDVGRIHVVVGDPVDPAPMTVDEILVEEGHVRQVGAVVVRIRAVDS